MAVKFVDHSDVVLKRVGTNCADAMNQVANMLVEAAQEKILYGYHDVHGNPPHTEIVETGILFDSLDAEVKRDSQNSYSITMGADTPYALYVHEGTRKLKGRPFLTDAINEKRGEVESILGREISKDL